MDYFRKHDNQNPGFAELNSFYTAKNEISNFWFEPIRWQCIFLFSLQDLISLSIMRDKVPGVAGYLDRAQLSNWPAWVNPLAGKGIAYYMEVATPFRQGGTVYPCTNDAC